MPGTTFTGTPRSKKSPDLARRSRSPYAEAGRSAGSMTRSGLSSQGDDGTKQPSDMDALGRAFGPIACSSQRLCLTIDLHLHLQMDAGASG